jgi:glycosidase
MVWKEFKYDDEALLPDQSPRQKACTVEFNQDLFNHYKKMISIRNAHPALRLGDFKTLLTDDLNDVYVYSRSYKDRTIIVALNNSGSMKKIRLNNIHLNFKDLLNGDEIYSENGNLEFEIKGKWGRVLRCL